MKSDAKTDEKSQINTSEQKAIQKSIENLNLINDKITLEIQEIQENVPKKKIEEEKNILEHYPSIIRYSETKNEKECKEPINPICTPFLDDTPFEKICKTINLTS